MIVTPHSLLVVAVGAPSDASISDLSYLAFASSRSWKVVAWRSAVLVSISATSTTIVVIAITAIATTTAAATAASSTSSTSASIGVETIWLVSIAAATSAIVVSIALSKTLGAIAPEMAHFMTMIAGTESGVVVIVGAVIALKECINTVGSTGIDCIAEIGIKGLGVGSMLSCRPLVLVEAFAVLIFRFSEDTLDIEIILE